LEVTIEHEWICTQCHKVVIARSYTCCGVVEEFSSERHGSLLVGLSNSWINVWKRWESYPLLREVSSSLASEGCYSASAVLSAFISRLLENVEGIVGTGNVDRELHPVGTRLLVTLKHYEHMDPAIYEVFVEEWSPGGLVKLGYANRWHRVEEVRVVEQLTGGAV
jgi:hypothetical protein